MPFKFWYADEPFARYRKRQIDDETLIDLLDLLVFQTRRGSALDEIGITDQSDASEMLLDYVLDALGVPGESENFSREAFEEAFYDGFMTGRLERPTQDLLDELKVIALDYEESGRLDLPISANEETAETVD